MNPWEEYEKRKDVKEALRIWRKDDILKKKSGFAACKHRLMDLLKVDRSEFYTWQIPVVHIFALKRISGWTSEQAWKFLKRQIEKE